MIVMTPLCHCRFCGAQMDVQFQPGWREAGHGHWICTCWAKTCPLFSMTSTADVYPALDLRPYGVAYFEQLQVGDVVLLDGLRLTVVYRDAGALWTGDGESVVERRFDVLTADLLVKVVDRVDVPLWVELYIASRNWHETIGD